MDSLRENIDELSERIQRQYEQEQDEQYIRPMRKNKKFLLQEEREQNKIKNKRKIKQQRIQKLLQQLQNEINEQE